jgi:hypothetical protein
MFHAHRIHGGEVDGYATSVAGHYKSLREHGDLCQDVVRRTGPRQVTCAPRCRAGGNGPPRAAPGQGRREQRRATPGPSAGGPHTGRAQGRTGARGGTGHAEAGARTRHGEHAGRREQGRARHAAPQRVAA